MKIRIFYNNKSKKSEKIINVNYKHIFNILIFYIK